MTAWVLYKSLESYFIENSNYGNALMLDCNDNDFAIDNIKFDKIADEFVVEFEEVKILEMRGGSKHDSKRMSITH